MQRVSKIRLACLLTLSVAAVLSFLLLLYGDRQADLLYRLLYNSYIPLQAPIYAFGGFHLICLGICILLTVLGGIAAWYWGTQPMIDRIVFAFGVAFFLLEWYKQVFELFVIGSGNYDFAFFPFQFCSLPLYACLLAPLLPNRWKHTLYCFLSLFGTVGGYLVMAYPAFPETLSMCVHTMLWHSLMIVLGGYLLIAERCGRSFVKDYLPAGGVFLVTVFVATVLNVLLHACALQSGSVLNLFYMSPYYDTYFLIVRDVQAHVGWGAALCTYCFLFFVAGALPIFFVGKLFCYVRLKLRKKEKTEKNSKKPLQFSTGYDKI